MQSLVGRCLIARFTGVYVRKGRVEELHTAALGLLLVSGLESIGKIEQSLQTAGTAHQQIAQMLAYGNHEIEGIETLAQNLVKKFERSGIVAGKGGIHHLERVLVIKNIEYALNILLADLRAAESHCLVEKGEGIAHCAIGLAGNQMQRLLIYAHSLLGGNPAEIAHHVSHTNAVEVIGLATGEYGRYDFVLLRGAENENRVCRRLLKGFEKSIESLLRKHVHLVYDIDAVLAHLRRNLHLFHQQLYVLHAVVGSGIELVDAVGAAFREGETALALAAWVHIGRRVGAVDGLCENSGSGGLAHSPRAAEKIGVRQLAPEDGILQRAGDIVLSDESLKGIGAIFAGRYYIIRHKSSVLSNPTNLIKNWSIHNFCVSLHDMNSRRLKYILCLLLLCTGLECGAQIRVYTRKARLSDFPAKTTKVVLSGFDILDVTLQNEIKSRWRISPFEFCSPDELPALLASPRNYVLYISTDKSGLAYMHLEKGGRKEGFSSMDNKLKVLSIPFSPSNMSTGRELNFLPAIISIIQAYVEGCLLSENLNYKGLEAYNGNLGRYKRRNIYISREDLSPAIPGRDSLESKLSGIEFTDEYTADSLFTEASREALIGFCIKSEKPGPKALSYQFIVRADNHELLYFKKNKYTEADKCGFSSKALKKIRTEHKFKR